MFDPSSRPNEPDPITTREMNSHIAYFLKRIPAWDAGKDRIPLDRQELPAQVRAELDVWHHQMFGEASPLAGNGINYHVVLAAADEDDDVVSYEVHWDDKRAKLFETKGQLGILFEEMKDQTSDVSSLYRSIHSISRLCIAGEFNWESRTPSQNEGSFAFSTNPRQSIYHAPAWHYRMDAGVFDGRLYILLYKRKGQLIGVDGGKWFDREFRLRASEAAHQAK
jgi:hypothetical protein